MAKYVPWVFIGEATNPPPPALVVTTTTLPPGVDESLYPGATLGASGGTAPYTWALVAPNNVLPTGMNFSSAGALTGTPTTDGIYTLVFRVTDAALATADSGEIQLVISAVTSGALAVTTTALPDGDRGQVYPTTALAATGGTPPYSWALVSPYTLPTGLSLSSTGIITGTPTVAGPDSIVVRVTDAVSATDDSGVLGITIDEVAALAITTPQQLPNGVIGTSYSRTFSSTGGWPPKTWTKVSGVFPSGLSLDGSTGVLSGTPTSEVTSNFRLRVTDSEGRQGEKDFSLSVYPEGAVEGPHDFYLEQISRPEIFGGENVGHWSFRSGASLDRALNTYPGVYWSYDPDNDPDEDAQDAARIIMPHSLGTANQLLTPFPSRISTGKLLIIADFYWAEECRNSTEPNGGLNHKFYQIEGLKPSGLGIYIEPRVFYRSSDPDPAIGTRNLRTYSMGDNTDYLGPYQDFGIIRNTSYTPTNGDYAAETYIQRYGVWTRHWFELHLDQPGTAFTEWNAAYTPGNPIGTGTITSAVVSGSDTLITVSSGEVTVGTGNKERQDNWWIDGSTDPAGCRVTIAGNSNPSLNTSWDVEVVDYTTLKIVGTALAGTGGTASKHFHMFTWWQAEEDVELFRMYYRIPIARRYLGEIGRFRHELNTSKKINALKGFFISVPPSIASPTVLTIGTHDFTTGDWAWVDGCDVIPTRSYQVTVVNATQVSIPVAVTGTASLNPEGEPTVQEVDFGDIGVGDSFTLRWRDNPPSTPVTFSSDMTSDISIAWNAAEVRAPDTTIVKISESIYEFTMTTTRSNLVEVIPTGFTPGDVTITNQGVSQSYYSGTYGRVTKPLRGYTRNQVLLRNFTTDEEDSSIFRKPVR